MAPLPVIHGRIRDHFHIDTVLGRGAFSKVYRALSTSAESLALLGDPEQQAIPVAIKVVDLNAYCAGFPRSSADRILALEVRILARLYAQLPNHQHIVKVYGILAEPSGDRAAIIMEELRGGELFDRIAKERYFSERDAANVIRVVAETLKHIHDIGILHRDLKPENLIFANNSPDSPLRLVDFGLASLVNEMDPVAELGAMVGTLGYVAPEIISSRSYSEACDVWSLGVILYILLSGHMPFGGRSPQSVLANTLNQQYNFSPNASWITVSDSAKHLITTMLMVDTSKRATLDDVLSHPWLTSFLISPTMPSMSTLSPLLPNNEESTSHSGQHRTDFFGFLEDYKTRRLARDVVLGARFGLKLRLLELVGGHDPNISLDQLKIMLQAFRDTSNHSDRATFDDFHTVMSNAAAVHFPLDTVFRLFDRAGQGTMSYVAFICHLASIRSLDVQVMEFCFRAHDVMGVGTLKRSQIAHLLRNLLSGRIIGGEMLNGTATQPWTDSMHGMNGKEESINATSLAFASLNVLDDTTSHLEERLHELFRMVGPSGAVGFDTFQKLFVNEPTLRKNLLAHVTLVAVHSNMDAERNRDEVSTMMMTTGNGVTAIQSMTFGMSLEAFDKAEQMKREGAVVMAPPVPLLQVDDDNGNGPCVLM